MEQVPIHLVKGGGEQHLQTYKDKNPMEQVPALQIDGLLLTQSVAIMEYLHDTHPEAGLLPTQPGERAKVRMVSETICSGIQPIQNLSVLQHHSPDPAARQAWSKHWISTGFRALETLLEDTAGECCVGDTVTMADCCLVPQVYNAQRFAVDMSEFPTISRLNLALSLRPEFEEAHPSNQPDCPPELRQ